ncbi:MAG: hypothetical protein WAV55_00535 [Clostridiaceae bacterium]
MGEQNKKLIEPLGLIGGFALLTLIGYLVFQNNLIQDIPGVIGSLFFINLWLVLILIAVKRDQSIPLLVITFYWLSASLIRLYVSNQAEEERAVKGIANRLSDYAAGALTGVGYFKADVIILIMALLALFSMVGLIMVLDKNKPRSDDPQIDMYL